MSNKKIKTTIKRLPKGKRTHVRRMKQAAHNAGIVYKEGSQ